MPQALLILDDIHLYEEMWRAWQCVSTMSGCSAAVNLGRFGVLVRDEAADRPRLYDLSRYTGWWPVRGSRQTRAVGDT